VQAASNILGNSRAFKAFSWYRKPRITKGGMTDATPALDQSGSVRACNDIDFIGIGDASRKPKYARRQ